ncbi:hypothetical protein RPYSC3_47970 [Rhodopseudomonas palustris]|nr:hypothetical protein RPYSC3_47970 [Rhodopseudomonas palustris]
MLKGILATLLAKQSPSMTPREKLYKAAYDSQHKDLTTIAPNDYGCAESLSRVIQKVLPSFPVYTATAALYPRLLADRRFVVVTDPEPGDIAIFPTEGAVVGHCGVWGKTTVMSNTSKTGKFEANYTHASWLAEAAKRGLKNHFLRLVEC